MYPLYYQDRRCKYPINIEAFLSFLEGNLFLHYSDGTKYDPYITLVNAHIGNLSITCGMSFYSKIKTNHYFKSSDDRLNICIYAEKEELIITCHRNSMLMLANQFVHLIGMEYQKSKEKKIIKLIN